MKIILFCDVCENDLEVNNKRSFIGSTDNEKILISVKPCSFCEELKFESVRKDIEKIVKKAVQKEMRKTFVEK